MTDASSEQWRRHFFATSLHSLCSSACIAALLAKWLCQRRRAAAKPAAYHACRNKGNKSTADSWQSSQGCRRLFNDDKWQITRRDVMVVMMLCGKKQTCQQQQPRHTALLLLSPLHTLSLLIQGVQNSFKYIRYKNRFHYFITHTHTHTHTDTEGECVWFNVCIQQRGRRLPPAVCLWRLSNTSQWVTWCRFSLIISWRSIKACQLGP